MKKGIVIFILSLVTAGGVSAQSLEEFKRQLSHCPTGGQVELFEAPDAAQAFAAASRSAAERRIDGWRINLFSSNAQNARAEAEEVKKSFEESFPGVSVDMVYDIPYFKVSAGRYATSEEAIMLLARIRNKFPKAFLMREAMKATDLLSEDPRPQRDSLSTGADAALPDPLQDGENRSSAGK